MITLQLSTVSYCTQYNVRRTMYTVLCTLYTNSQYILYTVLCTLYIIFYGITLSRIEHYMVYYCYQYIIYILLIIYNLYNFYYAVNFYCAHVHTNPIGLYDITVYDISITNIIHCTLYTIHCTMYIVYCVFWFEFVGT